MKNLKDVIIESIMDDDEESFDKKDVDMYTPEKLGKRKANYWIHEIILEINNTRDLYDRKEKIVKSLSEKDVKDLNIGKLISSLELRALSSAACRNANHSFFGDEKDIFMLYLASDIFVDVEEEMGKSIPDFDGDKYNYLKLDW